MGDFSDDKEKTTQKDQPAAEDANETGENTGTEQPEKSEPEPEK